MSESGFSAEWLGLREPADTRARAGALTQAVADTLPHDRVLYGLDLASGTGSNVRYLSQFIRSPQRWLLVDHSATLLRVATERLGAGAQTQRVDLARLDRLAPLFDGRDLVTGSALLDLVSSDWLEHVLGLCARARTAVLFALSYDGRLSCMPEDPEDGLVRDLVNEHQRTDKGFGPALGPEAAAHALAVLQELGYRVLSAQSDWQLDAGESELQRQLIEGWATAAIEIDPQSEGVIASWRVRRLAHVAAGRSRVTVGHLDVAGLM